MTEQNVRQTEVERIFLEVCELPHEERGVRLHVLCRDDEALRLEVASLLLHHDAAGSTINLPGVHGKDRDSNGRLGETIGAYQIVRELGRGGMGVVYLAERVDEGVQKFVAIKLLKRGLDTEALLRRFQQERQILSAIRHPGVAGFLDAGETEDGRPYFVMRYIDGLSLTEYCDVHRLDIAERLHLFQEVCDAVECVHRHLIVHRDLKPSNVLVTEDGQPRLLDFGIAKFLNPDIGSGGAPPTGPESRVLTPEYASPEQVLGNPLTTASDVYSLGVLLYEILCGHRPYHFSRESHQEVVEKVCERDPDAPSTAVGRTEGAEPTTGLSKPITPETVGRSRRSDPGRLRRRLQGDLDHIVMQALRKEPQRRYQSAHELRDDIDRYLGGRPVLASADTLVYRLSKFVRRNRVAVSAAAFVTLALVIGITGTTLGQVKAIEAQDLADGHLQDLVEVSRRYIEDLDEAVEVLDGSLPLREEFAEMAVELLTEATQKLEGREDRDARLTLGRAYRQLGEVEGSRRNPNRGHTDQAMRWYEKAQQEIETQIQREPADSEARRELALTLIARGDVLDGRREFDEARELDQQAYEISRELFDAAPSDWQARSDLAASLVVLGRDARRMNELDQAEEHFGEALKLRRGLAEQRPDDKQAQRSLSVVLFRVGIVRADKDDFNEARRRYEEAVRIRKELFDREPGNARFRRDYVTAKYMTAALLKGEGAYDDAVAHLDPTIPIWEENLRRNRRDTRSKRGLAMAQVLFGWLCIDLERWEDAEPALRDGLDLASELYDIDPKRSNYRKLLADSRHGLAQVFLERGEASEAKAALLAAIEIEGRTPELLTDLARAHEMLGEDEAAREAQEAARDKE